MPPRCLIPSQHIPHQMRLNELPQNTFTNNKKKLQKVLQILFIQKMFIRKRLRQLQICILFLFLFLFLFLLNDTCKIMVGCRSCTSQRILVKKVSKCWTPWSLQQKSGLLWRRPPVLLPALSQASHSPFCVHIHPCCRTATKTSSSIVEINHLSNNLLLSPSALLFGRSHSHDASSPAREILRLGETAVHTVRLDTGHPGGGSSRSWPAQWQPPHSPSLGRVAHGRSCGPPRQLSGSQRDQRTCHPSTSAQYQ